MTNLLQTYQGIFSKKIYKSVTDLTELWPRVWGLTSLAHPVYQSSPQGCYLHLHSRREPMNSRNHARVRRATNDKLYLRRRWYQRIPDARHWSVRRTQRGPVSAVPAPPCRLPSPASVSRDRRESPEAVAHSAAPSMCSSASELPASHNTRNAATVHIRSNWSDTESWIAHL